MRGAFAAVCLISILCANGACSSNTENSAYVGKDLNGESSVQFDRVKWANEAEAFDEPYVREKMLDDLLTRVLRNGMSSDEVTAQLGEPTDTSKFKDHDLVYFIGPERGLGVDSRWLLIKFDKMGKLNSVTVKSD